MKTTIKELKIQKKKRNNEMKRRWVLEAQFESVMRG